MKMQSNFPIQAMGNWLIAFPLTKSEEKVGSIILPDTVNVDIQYAQIVSLTADVENKFKIGEIIAYEKGYGAGQNIAGKFYLWFQLLEARGVVIEPEIFGFTNLQLPIPPIE